MVNTTATIITTKPDISGYGSKEKPGTIIVTRAGGDVEYYNKGKLTAVQRPGETAPSISTIYKGAPGTSGEVVAKFGGSTPKGEVKQLTITKEGGLQFDYIPKPELKVTTGQPILKQPTSSYKDYTTGPLLTVQKQPTTIMPKTTGVTATESLLRAQGLLGPILMPIRFGSKEEIGAATIRGATQTVETAKALFTPAKKYEGYETGAPKIQFQIPGTRETAWYNILGQTTTPQSIGGVLTTAAIGTGLGYAPKIAGGISYAAGTGATSVLTKTLGEGATRYIAVKAATPTARAITGIGGMALKGFIWPTAAAAGSKLTSTTPVKEFYQTPESKLLYQEGLSAREKYVSGQASFQSTLKKELEAKGFRDTAEDQKLTNALLIAQREQSLKNKWTKDLTQEEIDYAKELMKTPGYKEAYDKALTARKEERPGFISRAVSSMTVLGETEAFKQGVRDAATKLYKEQGYKGKELENKVELAVNAETRAIGARGAGQVGALLDISRSSETLGQVLVARKFAAGGEVPLEKAFSTTFKKVAAPLFVSGFGEGGAVYIAEATAKQQPFNPLKYITYGGIGGASAATLGGVIAASGARGVGAPTFKEYTKKIISGDIRGPAIAEAGTKRTSALVSKGLLYGPGYATDPTELAGDILSGKFRTAASAYYGRTPVEAAVTPTATGIRYGLSGGGRIAEETFKVPIKTTTATTTFVKTPTSTDVSSDITLPTKTSSEQTSLVRTPFIESPTAIVPVKTPTTISTMISSLIPVPTTAPVVSKGEVSSFIYKRGGYPTLTPTTEIVPTAPTPITPITPTPITNFIYAPVPTTVQTPVPLPTLIPTTITTPVAVSTTIPTTTLSGMLYRGGEGAGRGYGWNLPTTAIRKISPFEKEVFGTRAERESYRTVVGKKAVTSELITERIKMPGKKMQAPIKKTSDKNKIMKMLGR